MDELEGTPKIPVAYATQTTTRTESICVSLGDYEVSFTWDKVCVSHPKVPGLTECEVDGRLYHDLINALEDFILIQETTPMEEE